MFLDAVLVLLVALGHFAILIAVVNRSHGLGITCRWTDAITALSGLIAGVVGLLGMAWMVWAGSASWPPALWAYAAVCLAISLVVIPVAAIARARRRPPRGLTRGSKTVERVVGEDRAIKSGDSGAGGWILRIPGNESLSLEITENTLTLSRLPEELDGLSIVHLSDFHFTRMHDRGYFERVAEMTSPYARDLVLFSGDLIDDGACLEWVEPVFRHWRGGLARYAVLGNHDLYHRPERIAGALEAAGFQVLDGEWDRLELRGRTLAIGGTFEPWGRPLARPVPEADLSLVLSHTPDRIYDLSRLGVDLVVSGHNHGGQVRLPLIGPVLMPSLYGRRLEEGFIPVGATMLHVSRGLGAKYPIRMGCRPQVSVITLRRGSGRSRGQLPASTEISRAARGIARDRVP